MLSALSIGSSMIRPRVPTRPRFTLLELAIVVAILAALVGVAVPMTQPNWAPSPRCEARQELDTLRSAIVLHDSQNEALTGTSLTPLVGRYLQELRPDPWGHAYLFISEAGLILSLGADGQPGGDYENEDLWVVYKKAGSSTGINALHEAATN